MKLVMAPIDFLVISYQEKAPPKQTPRTLVFRALMLRSRALIPDKPGRRHLRARRLEACGARKSISSELRIRCADVGYTRHRCDAPQDEAVSGLHTDAELASGTDLVCRHVLLPAIGALIGDERQRDEDDRGRQQARPVIVAGRTPEPIVVRDPLA